MKFVDRTTEAVRLKAALNQVEPAFVALHGRRRLGKSTLIGKVLGSRDIYYLAIRAEKPLQMHLLAETIAVRFPHFEKARYDDWEALLLSLNIRTDERFTLCLDEFPYMVEQSPELPSVLQKLLDAHMLKYNVIICGSSQQSMYSILLDSTSPLYGRTDAMLKLAPLKLPYLQEALRLTDVEAIQHYAVLGGVPRYWELRERYGSLFDFLWGEVFSVNGNLYEEPLKLLKDDLRDPVKVSTIMAFVGSGANRISEIAARCGMPATNLSRPLAKLLDLNFLCREVPFGERYDNTKRSLYRIADPFMKFYFTYVIPFLSMIELGRIEPAREYVRETFGTFVSYAWEEACREAVTGNTICGLRFGEARRWWGTVSRNVTREFDVVAESLDGHYLLVGECKWTSREDPAGLLKSLSDKCEGLPFAKGRTILPVVFLKDLPDGPQTERVLLPADVIRLSR